jgi:hypothetical protein
MANNHPHHQAAQAAGPPPGRSPAPGQRDVGRVPGRGRQAQQRAERRGVQHRREQVGRRMPGPVAAARVVAPAPPTRRTARCRGRRRAAGCAALVRSAASKGAGMCQAHSASACSAQATSGSVSAPHSRPAAAWNQRPTLRRCAAARPRSRWRAAGPAPAAARPRPSAVRAAPCARKTAGAQRIERRHQRRHQRQPADREGPGLRADTPRPRPALPTAAQADRIAGGGQQQQHQQPGREVPLHTRAGRAGSGTCARAARQRRASAGSGMSQGDSTHRREPHARITSADSAATAVADVGQEAARHPGRRRRCRRSRLAAAQRGVAERQHRQQHRTTSSATAAARCMPARLARARGRHQRIHDALRAQRDARREDQAEPALHAHSARAPQ